MANLLEGQLCAIFVLVPVSYLAMGIWQVSRAQERKKVEHDLKVSTPCPRCGGSRMILGMEGMEEEEPRVGFCFVPCGLAPSRWGGERMALTIEPVRACLDCGLAWSRLDKDRLLQDLSKHAPVALKKALGISG